MTKEHTMSTTRVLTAMLFGALGGGTAEIVDLLFRRTRDPRAGAAIPLVDWRYYALGCVVGLCIGAGLGAAEGVHSGSRGRCARATLYGALGGMVCGYVGFGIGGLLYALLGGDPRLQGTTTGFLRQVLARSLAW